MKLIDSHCHLDASQFNDDRHEMIQRALDAGIHMITIGTNLETSEAAINIAHQYDLHAVVGIHPHDAERYSDGKTIDSEALEVLEQMYSDERVVALGEMGLDYFKEYSPKDAQHVVFRAQLELAQSLNAPVVIHNRDSESDVIQTLTEIKSHGVVHSFTGDSYLAQKILDLGFYLGVNGIATFPKSNVLRAAIKKIPHDKLLIETDCPYLAPVQHRGKRNEPLYVEDVARVVAGSCAIQYDEFAKMTTNNAKRLFGLE